MYGKAFLNQSTKVDQAKPSSAGSWTTHGTTPFISSDGGHPLPPCSSSTDSVGGGVPPPAAADFETNLDPCFPKMRLVTLLIISCTFCFKAVGYVNDE